MSKRLNKPQTRRIEKARDIIHSMVLDAIVEFWEKYPQYKDQLGFEIGYNNDPRFIGFIVRATDGNTAGAMFNRNQLLRAEDLDHDFWVQRILTTIETGFGLSGGTEIIQ
jgi:hypothetical protein